MKSVNSRRNGSRAIAVVCALVILVSGTFAFQAISQWALGQFVVAPVQASARLHNSQQVMGTNFGEAIWTQGMTSDKAIFVENFGDHSDVFVRVRLYEYMELGPGARLQPGDAGYANRLARPIIDTMDRDDVSTWIPRKPQAGISDAFRDYWGWTQGGQKYFMPTFNRDIMSMETDVRGDARSMRNLGDGEIVNTTHIGESHAFSEEAGRNDFFSRPENATHTAMMKYWRDSHAVSSYEVTHTARQTLPATTMLMSEWAGEIGNFWVLDEDGWAYWAAPLAPGAATGLLLQNITLNRAPTTEAYYAIFADAQMATSADVLEAWGDDLTSGAMVLVRMAARISPIPELALGETFTDSRGMEWRILAHDANGNSLIITEHVYGVGTQWHSVNRADTRLHNSNVMRPTLNDWFDGILAPELRAFALPAANLHNDVRSTWGPAGATTTNENAPAGWTSAGSGAATGANSLFLLSISEFNRYSSVLNRVATTPAGVTAFWWLRSPGVQPNWACAAVVNTGGTVASDDSVQGQATSTQNGFRPALWVGAVN